MAVANNGVVDTWDFSDKHLDPNIASGDGNAFFNSARCILYAALSNSNNVNTRGVFNRIGVVQGFNFSENKSIDTVFELGSDIPYYVPGRTVGQLQIQRILLAGEDLINLIYQDGATTASGNKKFITSLKDVRLNKAFDLLFAYYGANVKGGFDASYSRLFKNCYFNGRSEGIMAGQTLVAESVGVMYEYISNVNFLAENTLART